MIRAELAKLLLDCLENSPAEHEDKPWVSGDEMGFYDRVTLDGILDLEKAATLFVEKACLSRE